LLHSCEFVQICGSHFALAPNAGERQIMKKVIDFLGND